MKAYHGNQSTKDYYINRVRAHRVADEIINGKYWEGGKGCAVGCTLHSSRHKDYETELGIPEVLARLEDRLFESLYLIDTERAKEWPERFLSCVKVGSDLSLVFPQLMHWILLDKETGVIRRAKSDRIFAAVKAVGDLYARWAAGTKPDVTEWRAARIEAREAWWQAPAFTAEAEAAAGRRYSAVWNETYNARMVAMSDKLIELMSAAPVGAEEGAAK